LKARQTSRAFDLSGGWWFQPAISTALIYLLRRHQVAASDAVVASVVYLQTNGYQHQFPVRMIDPAQHLEIACSP
jgi:hypothetical protein